MANDLIQIRARIAQLEAQRARIDTELAILRKSDSPPPPFAFLEAPGRIEGIPLLAGPVKGRRRRFDEGAN